MKPATWLPPACWKTGSIRRKGATGSCSKQRAAPERCRSKAELLFVTRGEAEGGRAQTEQAKVEANREEYAKVPWRRPPAGAGDRRARVARAIADTESFRAAPRWYSPASIESCFQLRRSRRKRVDANDSQRE